MKRREEDIHEENRILMKRRKEKRIDMRRGNT